MRVSNMRKLMMLKVSQIKPYEDKIFYNTNELNSLLSSISANGIIEPIIVRKEAKGKYLLLSGGKRLYCAKEIGLRRVPCIVYKTDELSGFVYQLTSNLCRSDSPFFKNAELIEKIIKIGNLSPKEAAARLGLSPCAIENKLRLLSLSGSVKSQIKRFNLSEVCAQILSRTPPDIQEALITKAVSEGFSPHRLQEEISHLLSDEEKEENIDFTVREIKPSGHKIKSSIKDNKFLSNSLLRLVSTAEESGLKATFKTVETEKYTEYKIRINKNFVPAFEQLKIV